MTPQSKVTLVDESQLDFIMKSIIEIKNEILTLRESKDMEEPWTLSQVSEYFKHSERWVMERVEEGKLKPYKIEGKRKLLFEKHEVKNLWVGIKKI